MDNNIPWPGHMHWFLWWWIQAWYFPFKGFFLFKAVFPRPSGDVSSVPFICSRKRKHNASGKMPWAMLMKGHHQWANTPFLIINHFTSQFGIFCRLPSLSLSLPLFLHVPLPLCSFFRSFLVSVDEPLKVKTLVFHTVYSCLPSITPSFFPFHTFFHLSFPSLKNSLSTST